LIFVSVCLSERFKPTGIRNTIVVSKGYQPSLRMLPSSVSSRRRAFLFFKMMERYVLSRGFFPDLHGLPGFHVRTVAHYDDFIVRLFECLIGQRLQTPHQ